MEVISASVRRFPVNKVGREAKPKITGRVA